MIFHTVDLMNQILPILFLQLAMLVLAYCMRTHWFFVFVQILGVYAAGVACIWDINAHLSWRNAIENFVYLTLWNYIFYLAMLAITFIQPTEYQRSLLLAILGITLFYMGFYTLFGKYELAKIGHLPILAFGLPVLWYAIFVFVHIQKQFHVFALCILTTFAAGLIYFGYFEIFICLAIISWALRTQDKVIYSFALVTFALILGFVYYALDVTFLIKSLSMFLSGVMLLLLTLSLNTFKQKEELGV